MCKISVTHIDPDAPGWLQVLTHKMEELNFYLDFLKGKDEKEVHKLLENLHLLDLKNRPAQMAELAKKLLEFSKEEKPKEKKAVKSHGNR